MDDPHIHTESESPPDNPVTGTRLSQRNKAHNKSRSQMLGLLISIANVLLVLFILARLPIYIEGSHAGLLSPITITFRELIGSLGLGILYPNMGSSRLFLEDAIALAWLWVSLFISIVILIMYSWRRAYPKLSIALLLFMANLVAWQIVLPPYLEPPTVLKSPSSILLNELEIQSETLGTGINFKMMIATRTLADFKGRVPADALYKEEKTDGSYNGSLKWIEINNGQAIQYSLHKTVLTSGYESNVINVSCALQNNKEISIETDLKNSPVTLRGLVLGESIGRAEKLYGKPSEISRDEHSINAKYKAGNSVLEIVASTGDGRADKRILFMSVSVRERS